MKNDVKIAVVYHSESRAFPASFLLPLHVGSSPSKGILRDDEGDNISFKNPFYNEMTAVYWAWKHYDEIGSPAFFGLCHYRRFFIFSEKKYPYYETENFEDVDADAFSEEGLDSILSSHSVVAPMRTKRRSVGGSYALSHHKEDLDLAMDIIKRNSPEMEKLAKEYLSSDGIYYYNMFILKKELFFEYASWVFPILEEFEEKTLFKGERMFISEILTGIFLYSLKTTRSDFLELPVVFVIGKKPSFSSAVKEVKNNFKNKKSGVLYNFRPLILFLAPRKIMLRRRQRRVK